MSLKESGILKKRGQPIPRRPWSTNMSTDNISIDDDVSSNQASSLCKENFEKLIKTCGLLLPRLDYSIFVENPTLQTLLMHGENSNYVMTEDEMNHLQWELESILTTDIIRQNTIRDEIFTYYVAMYTHKLPMIKSSADKQMSSINTFRNVEVEFGPSRIKLESRKFESTKFWSFVKPYFASVTRKDLKWLKNRVKSYDFTKKLQDISSLGEYYSKKWAKYELEMQKIQSPCSSPQGIENINESIFPDVVELAKKVNATEYDGSLYVPIYQRIVATITKYAHVFKENIEEHSLDSDDKEKSEELTAACKQLYAEQGTKKQLNQLGLMSRYSNPMSPEVFDAILNEIIKCKKNSLVQLEKMNKKELGDLLEECHVDYRVRHIIEAKVEVLKNKINNFKRQENESWTEEQKIAQIAKEDYELETLLNLLSSYNDELQSIISDHFGNYTHFSDSDESENSGSEYDSDGELESPKIYVVTKIPKHDISVNQSDKTEDECVTEKITF